MSNNNKYTNIILNWVSPIIALIGIIDAWGKMPFIFNPKIKDNIELLFLASIQILSIGLLFIIIFELLKGK